MACDIYILCILGKIGKAKSDISKYMKLICVWIHVYTDLSIGLSAFIDVYKYSCLCVCVLYYVCIGCLYLIALIVLICV